jgi:inward rectifier potassium channel
MTPQRGGAHASPDALARRMDYAARDAPGVEHGITERVMSGEVPRPPPSSAPSEIRVIGARRALFRDTYHRFLRAPWWAALLVIVVSFLFLNAVFALLYLATGGIANARDGSFTDALYFSVQTMGTIGYGSMYPLSTAANVLVIAEAVVGLMVTAVATGLLFSKFSQSTARIVFTREVAIAPMDGVPTLTFRVGNERGNQIVEATIRVVLIRTERTREGMTIYRMYDLPLARERTPALSRSWMAMHAIVPGSMLHGQTPASIKASEVELVVTLFGTDDTSLQPVHGRHRYTDDQIIWGARHADILHEDERGQLVLDLHKFHELIPTSPTKDFPYPEGTRPEAGSERNRGPSAT